LVDWKVDPGSTKMLIQEHVVLGEITFTKTWGRGGWDLIVSKL